MPSVVELEQKFVVSSETVGRLKELGFAQVKEFEMVDWYFDFPQQSFPMIRQDTWLRFREQVCRDDAGQWELKQGGPTQQQKTTIYQESVGKEALDIVQELFPTPAELQQDAQAASAPTDMQEFEGLSVPALPSDVTLQGLLPFARIVTLRSTWRRRIAAETTKQEDHEQQFETEVSVDLDQTDFGHNVGEVEMVIPASTTGTEDDDASAKQQLEQAKTRIQELITQLTEATSDETATTSKPRGKLEFFLQSRKPSIFAILLEAGIVES